MPATIRPAEPTDLAAMLGLYRQLNRQDPQPDAGRAEKTWQQILADEMITVFVAETAGRVVACCMIVIVPNLTRDVRPFGVIENVVTDAAFRGRGLGKQVIAAAVEWAWANGCYKVMLATGSKEEATLNFYEACGFLRGKTAFDIRRPEHLVRICG